MPPRPRLEVERSVDISAALLSPRYGCGLMLGGLPKYDSSDALVNIMENYGYTHLFADKPARKILDNSSLLKTFHENAFIQKMPVRRNFHGVYGQRDIWLALDTRAKSAWFVADAQNRMALVNYHRDAVSLGLKPHGVTLVGSIVRLSPYGWQNLFDLLSDEFLDLHREIERVEVMSALSGVRWRQPVLGIGAAYLNFREADQVKETVEAVLRGENDGEIQG